MKKKIDIPFYSDYYPNVKEENKKIRKAYKYLAEQWDQGKYVEIDIILRKTSYLFYYLYTVNSEFFKSRTPQGIKRVSDKYEFILKYYGKQVPKLAYYASLWIVTMAKSIGDEALVNKWTEYYLEHPHPSKIKRFQSETLINLYYTDEKSYIPGKLFNEILPIHSKLTPFGQEFETEIENFIIQKVNHEYKETGTNFVSSLMKIGKTRLHVPSTHDGSFRDNFDIFTAKPNEYKVKKFIKQCENEWRELQDLPLIGEGWIHETQLRKMLQETFSNTVVEAHARPEFLGQQHYDVYFPKYKIACEYQGDQHFRAVSYFGGEKSLELNKERDARKKKISDDNKVTLIYVMPDYDPQKLVEKIARKMRIKTPEVVNVSINDLPSINDLIATKKRKSK